MKGPPVLDPGMLKFGIGGCDGVPKVSPGATRSSSNVGGMVGAPHDRLEGRWGRGFAETGGTGRSSPFALSLVRFLLFRGFMGFVRSSGACADTNPMRTSLRIGVASASERRAVAYQWRSAHVNTPATCHLKEGSCEETFSGYVRDCQYRCSPACKVLMHILMLFI